MNTITIIILLIIAAFSGMCVGYSSARLKMLDRWGKMLDKLDTEKVNPHFGKGALWAFKIVEKGENVDYEHKTN